MDEIVVTVGFSLYANGKDKAIPFYEYILNWLIRKLFQNKINSLYNVVKFYDRRFLDSFLNSIICNVFTCTPYYILSFALFHLFCGFGFYLWNLFP